MLLKELMDLYYYLKRHPDEAKRFDQCFHCKKLSVCLNDVQEDESGTCKEFEPVKEERKH